MRTSCWTSKWSEGQKINVMRKDNTKQCVLPYVAKFLKRVFLRCTTDASCDCSEMILDVSEINL